MLWLRSLLILCAVLSGVSHAATRDFPISWNHSLTDVDGNSLDEDGDGVPELLTGYRIYDESGVLLSSVSGDTNATVIRRNVPWGRHCLKMRAYIATTTGEEVSDWSNTGACLDVQPGKPTAPEIK